MSKSIEDKEMIIEYRQPGALGMVKAVVDKLRYPATDFRRYITKWNGVNGWLTPVQATWLFEIAKNDNIKGDIVEIGSAYGRSAVALALGISLSGRDDKIYCVDPHIGGKGFREKLKDKDSYSSFEGFKRNLRRFDIEKFIVPIVKTSEAGVKDWKQGNKIRLLFIDGWHTYEAVTFDILGWSRHMAKGGVIALHDYQEQGVRDAIHDCLKKLKIKESELKHADDEMVFFRIP